MDEEAPLMSAPAVAGGSVGWVDLAVTFADAVLAVPPVPSSLREGLVRVGDWCWSTRPDIDPMAMYMFDRYLTEATDEGIGDYVAVSHAGHGANSYGLNFHLVFDGVGFFVQHLWGGVYMNPMETRTAIACTYAVLGQLLNQMNPESNPESTAGGVDRVLCYSDFRGACDLWSRRDIAAAGATDDGSPPGPWSRREFTSEQALLAFAADTLCPPDRASELVPAIREAFDA